jgi:hypothetical protein
MRQPTDAPARAAGRDDLRAPPAHRHAGTDGLPAPFGRMLPELAPGPAPDVDPVPDDDHRSTVLHATGPDAGFRRLVAHDLGILADPAPGVLPSPANGPPVLRLDGLYADGPLTAPQLYDTTDRARLRWTDQGSDGSEARNALAALHDTVVDEVRAEGVVFWPVVFSEARRRVVHRYQRTVLDELLPRWVGRPLVEAIRRHGRRFYRPNDVPFVPLELLAVASWLAPAHPASRPCPVPWTLPPGHDVARALGVAPLAPTDAAPDLPLDGYVAAESRIVAGGRRLGPVGGRILAEVVIGVLELDDDSCLDQIPTRPTKPTRPTRPTQRT